MKTQMKILLSATALLFVAPIIAQEVTAQETTVLKPLNVIMMEGNYAGTFLCSSGEMGMSLSLQDLGPTINPDGKSVSNSKRLVNGVINFFPTLGNPGAPHGAFEVGGTADVYSNFSRIKLNPGKWLDKPDSFGASGLDGMITKSGHITGKPTADGCHTLRLTKLRTK